MLREQELPNTYSLFSFCAYFRFLRRMAIRPLHFLPFLPRLRTFELTHFYTLFYLIPYYCSIVLNSAVLLSLFVVAQFIELPLTPDKSGSYIFQTIYCSDISFALSNLHAFVLLISFNFIPLKLISVLIFIILYKPNIIICKRKSYGFIFKFL